MDKTLEIVLVAVALVVSVVIVIGILQGQANKFGEFSESQTDNSDCSVSTNQLKVYCPNSNSGGSCSDWDETAAENTCDSSSCSGDLDPGNICS